MYFSLNLTGFVFDSPVIIKETVRAEKSQRIQSFPVWVFQCNTLTCNANVFNVYASSYAQWKSRTFTQQVPNIRKITIVDFLVSTRDFQF